MTNRISNEYGAFEVSSLPGQSQVAVTHGFVVPENARGKGFAHELKALQALELDRLNYDYAVCTVAGGNDAQKKVLKKAGRKKLDQFRNTRSSETTEIWGASL